MTIPTSERLKAVPTALPPDADRVRHARRAGLIAILLIVVAASTLLPRTVRKMPDFEVYWRAAQRVTATQPINQPQDGHFQHKYLPAFAYVMIPFGRLTLRTGKAVWFYIIVASIIALVSVSVYSLPTHRRAPYVLVLVTTIAMLKFFARELTLGQSNALMALVVVCAAARDRAGRSFIAGVLFALAILFKPYAIVFLAYLVWTRRLATAAVAIACVGAAVALPAINYGFAGNITLLEQWVQTLSNSTPVLLLNPDNVSVWAMYAKWFGVSSGASLGALLTCVVLLAFAMYATSRPREAADLRYLDIALLLLLLPLWSPQGWDYVLLMATPAVIAFVNWSDEVPQALRRVTVVALAIIALSIYDLLGRHLYAEFMATSAITVCSLVLVSTTVMLRVRLSRVPFQR